MTLTEKIKADMGGVMFKVFEVSALSGGTNGVSISLGAVQMNEVLWANFTFTDRTMTAGSTTWPVLQQATTSGGVGLTLSGLIASATPDTGLLEVWGY